MTAHNLKKTITGAALILAVFHVLMPDLNIDGVTLGLFVVAVIPWLQPLFKSVALPGGLKVEYRDLAAVEERADEAGLLAAPVAVAADAQPEYSFQLVADEDPNLALAGLRIEIERRLGQIAEARGIDARRSSAGRLIRELSQQGALRQEERAVLEDMIGLLNSAVHGADVDPRAADWALSVGPRVLEGLEQRAQ